MAEGARFELAVHEVDAGFQARIPVLQMFQGNKEFTATHLFFNVLANPQISRIFHILRIRPCLLTAVVLSLCCGLRRRGMITPLSCRESATDISEEEFNETHGS